MIINSLHIKNFFSYCGDYEDNHFQFEKGVNIISGANGSGKSKLFNAFYWALYDTVYLREGRVILHNNTSKRDSIASEKAINNSNVGDQLEVGVKISISVEDNKFDFESKYFGIRTFTLHRKSIFNVSSDSSSKAASYIQGELDITYQLDTGQTKYVEEDEHWNFIDLLFPHSLRDYMWFQGETIDSLIDLNSHSKSLKTAIDEISYLNRYTELANNVEQTFHSVNKMHTKSTKLSRQQKKERTELQTKLESEQKTLERKESALLNCSEELNSINNEINRLEKKLDETQDLRHLDEELQSLTNHQRDLRRKFENLASEKEREFKKKVFGYNPSLDTDKIISRLDDYKKDRFAQVESSDKTNNAIPLAVPGKTYIQKMLEDERCGICGSEAKKGTDLYQNLLDRLNHLDLEKADKERSKLEKFVQEIISAIDRHNDCYAFINEELNNFAEKYGNFEADYVEVNNKIRELKSSIPSTDNTHDWKETYDRISSERGKEKRESSLKHKLEAEIKESKNNIAKFKNKLASATQTDDVELIRFESISKHLEILENAFEHFEGVSRDKLVDTLERESNVLYQQFLEDSNTPCGTLKINRENLTTDIVDDDGDRLQINQGNEILAKISLINTILKLNSDEIGQSYPLIVDAPSSVFDTTNTKSYTRNIGKSFEQVILISKDYENEDMLEMVKKDTNCSAIYQITFKGENGHANIKTSSTTISRLK